MAKSLQQQLSDAITKGDIELAKTINEKINKTKKATKKSAPKKKALLKTAKIPTKLDDTTEFKIERTGRRSSVANTPLTFVDDGNKLPPRLQKIDKKAKTASRVERRPAVKKEEYRCKKCGSWGEAYASELTPVTDEKGRGVPVYICNDCCRD